MNPCLTLSALDSQVISPSGHIWAQLPPPPCLVQPRWLAEKASPLLQGGQAGAGVAAEEEPLPLAGPRVASWLSWMWFHRGVWRLGFLLSPQECVF